MARTAPRLYQSGHWTSGSSLTLDPERSHYLAGVLRAQVGHEVRLFNAERGEWTATVAKLTKKAVTLTVDSLARAPLPIPERVLLFAPIKRTQLEWLIEKAVELGVTRFVPVITERTQGRGELNLDRLRTIACEAAEQCERLDLPGFATPQPLTIALAHWPQDKFIAAALERSAASRLSGDHKVAALLVGPEGGFSEAEQAWLVKQPCIRPVSLGPRILRAETAAIAGLALLGLQDC